MGSDKPDLRLFKGFKCVVCFVNTLIKKSFPHEKQLQTYLPVCAIKHTV